MKPAGILSGKSSGGVGDLHSKVGALGVLPGRLPASSCSPFVPWKELMSRVLSVQVPGDGVMQVKCFLRFFFFALFLCSTRLLHFPYARAVLFQSVDSC